MNVKEIVEFYQKVIASLEGDISDADFQQMMLKVQDDPEAAYFYSELIKIHTNLCCPKLADSVFNGEDVVISKAYYDLINGRTDTWMALLETEISAPSTPKIIDKSLSLQTGSESVTRKMKLSLYAFTFAAVAMIFVAVMLQINTINNIIYNQPPSLPATYQEVATLTESVNAVFEDEVISADSLYRFSTDSMPVVLKSGVAKIEFDTGVSMLLEGPAEITFTAANECFMEYGSIYASVSKSGYGFTVSTNDSRIVDLGTEFGVTADKDGNVEMHVLKGKTSVIGKNSRNESVYIAGQACRIVRSVGRPVSIACDKNKYIRVINSEQGTCWRGQDVDLASIVAGGDGVDIPDDLCGIDPLTGEVNDIRKQDYQRYGDFQLHSVPSREFIDGVFVPDGSKLFKVTSDGHVFRECPVTSNSYWCDITTNNVVKKDSSEGSKMINVKLGEMEFGKGSGNDMIFMHSNAGITFDLAKIRNKYNISFKSFTADCGVVSNVGVRSKAVMMVLIDGECVYTMNITREGNVEPEEIDLKLNDKDKFLTLVVVDGGDENGYDWCVFANPILRIR